MQTSDASQQPITELSTWMAMDKFGRIAFVLSEYEGGKTPPVLFQNPDLENGMDVLTEYIREESTQYQNYPPNKNGDFILDCYSLYQYDYIMAIPRDRDLVITKALRQNLLKRGAISDTNIPVNKGFFVYQDLNSGNNDKDIIANYSGPREFGDYFRYLIPTVYGGLEDIPKDLHCYIAASDSLDFAQTRLIEGSHLAQLFTRLASDNKV